jgi:regulator of nucleoside diphosphate kinase
MEKRVILSRSDVARLHAILAQQMRSATHDQEHLSDLHEEIEHATVVEPEKMPADVVTMGSTVRVVDLETRDSNVYTLVSPAQADIRARRVSVTAPLGTALLGYRQGDHVIWSMPGGVRQLRIQKVVQPGGEGGACLLRTSSIVSSATTECA